jgi:hypothetical protein
MDRNMRAGIKDHQIQRPKIILDFRHDTKDGVFIGDVENEGDDPAGVRGGRLGHRVEIRRCPGADGDVMALFG